MSLKDSGWHHYQSHPAPEGVLLEFGYYTDRWLWRELRYHELDTRSEQNTCGLYWRWTGIGREEYFARHPEPKVQPTARLLKLIGMTADEYAVAYANFQWDSGEDSLHCHEGGKT